MSVVVLRERQKLPSDRPLSVDHHYDAARQIWIDGTQGLPLVDVLLDATEPTKFGETLITATREGADQSEIATLRASQFGETTITKTFEGADQGEHSSWGASTFGETSLTRTHEGADQSELS